MSQVKIEKATSLVASLETKLAAARVSLATLLEAAAAEAARLNIAVGTEGTFVFGRADTAKELAGKVVAVVELEGGAKLLKVLAGEGAALRIYDVAPAKFSPVADEAETETDTDGINVDALLYGSTGTAADAAVDAL